MNRHRQEFGFFVERVEGAGTDEAVRDLFLDATAKLGFRYAALFTPILTPGICRVPSMERTPKGWVEHYMRERYFEIDHVFSTIRTRTAPFAWDACDYQEDLSARHRRLLAETRDAGLSGGLAIPIIQSNADPACCMLVPDVGGVDQSAFAVAHSLAVFAYARARQVLERVASPVANSLSRRERECLLLAARGKSDWAIGAMLGLSERTIHHSIERAKRRLGVATRVQAIVIAIHRGEFSAEEAIG